MHARKSLTCESFPSISYDVNALQGVNSRIFATLVIDINIQVMLSLKPDVVNKNSDKQQNWEGCWQCKLQKEKAVIRQQ